MGGGNRKNTMQNAKIGAKKDKITVKSHFPMDFFKKLLIIQFHLYQQITIIKNEM